MYRITSRHQDLVTIFKEDQDHISITDPTDHLHSVRPIQVQVVPVRWVLVVPDRAVRILRKDIQDSPVVLSVEDLVLLALEVIQEVPVVVVVVVEEGTDQDQEECRVSCQDQWVVALWAWPDHPVIRLIWAVLVLRWAVDLADPIRSA